MYGKVMVRLTRPNMHWESGTLLDFTTIPVKFDDEAEHKVIVYGIVELDTGSFVARQLQEIMRDKDTIKVNGVEADAAS